MHCHGPLGSAAPAQRSRAARPQPLPHPPATPTPQDSGLHEARFYLALLRAGAASTPSEVADAEGGLLAPLQALVGALGPDSMTVRLALGQHSRLAGLALDASLPLGEAFFKQHARLQVRGRGGGHARGARALMRSGGRAAPLPPLNTHARLRPRSRGR